MKGGKTKKKIKRAIAGSVPTQISLEIATERACGDCQACCDLVGVEEIGKPYATKCQHQCPGGCAIYATRPQGCKVYECLWRINKSLLLDWQPSKSGILLYHDHYDDERVKLALWVCEVWQNSIQTKIVMTRA